MTLGLGLRVETKSMHPCAQPKLSQEKCEVYSSNMNYSEPTFTFLLSLQREESFTNHSPFQCWVLHVLGKYY